MKNAIYKGVLKNKNRYTLKKKIRGIKRKIGGSKESILIILVSNEMYEEFIPKIDALSKYINHLSNKYNVDVAAISSKDDFSKYSTQLTFKYTHINTKPQLSKVCDFFLEYKSMLNYDWYVKIRPEIEILDYDTIDFSKLPKDSINARVRNYRGPYRNKHSCSVGGEGLYKSVKACFYSPHLELIKLDDSLYIFHKNVVDNGGFSPVDDNPTQTEEFHSMVWSSRNIPLNIISINIKFSRKKNGSNSSPIHSGDIINDNTIQ